MSDTKNKCSECKYYSKLDTTCGLCTYWDIWDRVHIDNNCKKFAKKHIERSDSNE